MLQTMQARSERCCEGGTKLDIVMQVTFKKGTEERQKKRERNGFVESGRRW